jgi:hypothetical protein
MHGYAYSSHPGKCKLGVGKFLPLGKIRCTWSWLIREGIVFIWSLTKLYQVRCQVLTSASMNMTAFCDISPCNLVEADRHFRGAYCFHHQDDDRPDDGGSTHLWNVGQLLHYTECLRKFIIIQHFGVRMPQPANIYGLYISFLVSCTSNSFGFTLRYEVYELPD